MKRHILVAALTLLVGGLVPVAVSTAAGPSSADQSNASSQIQATRRKARRISGGYIIIAPAPISGGGGTVGGIPGNAGSTDSFSFDANGAMLMNGTKIFPIGITIPPPPGSTTPTGKNAYQELSDGGVMFVRTGKNTTWDSDGLAIEKSYEDEAAAHGLHCQLWLRNLAQAQPGDTATEATLKMVVNTFKNHPGLGVWKGDDEPFWAGTSPATVQNVRTIIRSLDQKHPVWLVQALRGTFQTCAHTTLGAMSLESTFIRSGIRRESTRYWPTKRSA